MDDYHQVIICSFLAMMAGVYVVRWYNDPLRAIPTVGGSSLPGLSYLGALRMLGDCRDVLEEGYRKYPDSAFKVPVLDRWMVFVSGRNMIENLRKSGDEELSSIQAFEEVLQLRHIYEHPLNVDKYHVGMVKDQLTPALPAMLPDIVDEVATAVKDHIIASEHEWTDTEIIPALKTIITRCNNRAFVGLPLCRNEGYLALANHFAVGMFKSAVILRLFPRFLKPLVAWLVNPIYAKNATHHAMEYVQPLIKERQKAMAELGEEWNDKPNDALQFLLDQAATKNETAFVIAQRLLVLNTAAIHNSVMTLTHALYHLAEKTVFVPPLREEIEMAISAHGWTEAGLGKMWKLDSFLRETLRYHGIGLLSMSRVAMKDVVLQDGTRLPRGTMVAVTSYAMHHDTALLSGADIFDPFRFARMRGAEEGPGQGAKHQLTSTSPEFLAFAHGRHACPGRYFAAKELKAILAHIILNYDMKLGGDGSRPPNVYFAMSVLPALGGCILFRKRGGSV